MLKSSGSIAAATFLSRILGLVREMVFAAWFGASAAKGAFDLAYMVPNLFRRLLGEGALTAAFIPIFKKKEIDEGEEAMWHAANAVVSGLVVSVSVLAAGFMAGITLVLSHAPLSAETYLMLDLLRIMFPYVMLVCLAATFMGMLNARGYFFIPALGATLLNVVLITAVVVFAPRLGEHPHEQIFALAWGVLAAGVAQALFQLPALYRSGFRCRWVSPWNNETVRQVVRKMLPGIVGVAAFQINMLTTQGIAFIEGASIVASFNFAVRLMEFPQGVFGVSLATFILPALAGLAAENKLPEFKATLREGLGYAAYINLFAAAMTLVLAEPIARLLFERGNFDAGDTRNVAIVLQCLAPSLAAYTAVNLLSRAFFALGDVKTPMKISVACLTLNLVFVLFLIHPFQQAGLGAANSASSLINVWLLLHALKLKLKNTELAPLGKQVGLMVLAAVFSALIALAVKWGLERSLPDDSLLARLGLVFLPMLFAGGAYWAVTHWLRIDAARSVMALLGKITRRKSAK